MALNIISNWISEDDSSLDKILQHCEVIPSDELATLLDEEKCISLIPGPSSSPKECSLRISRFTSNIGVKSILLFSEASIGEIYINEFEEYHQTLYGEVVQECEDSKIFKMAISFDKTVTNICVKLKHLLNHKSLWIYGLYVQTDVTQSCIPKNTFSDRNLTSLISENNIELSEKAESFKNFLGKFNGNNYENPVVSGPGGYPPMSLMAMMLSSASSKNRYKSVDNGLSSGNADPNSKYDLGESFNELNLEDKVADQCNNEKTLVPDEKDIDCSSSINDVKDKMMNKLYSKLETSKSNPALSPNIGNKSMQDFLSLAPYTSNIKNTDFMCSNISSNLKSQLGSSSNHSGLSEDQLFNKIEKCIENKINAAENRIIQHIDNQLLRIEQENNKKLNEILRKLENIGKI